MTSLSIARTVKPPRKPPINDWYKYIHKSVENTVRPGGIAYRDLDHVEQFKRQLNIK